MLLVTPYFKKLIVYVTVMSLVAWTIGITMLVPKPAHAAITATGIFGQVPSGGLSLPASSFENPVAKFTLSQSASETLSSVTVTLTNETSGAVEDATLASHIDSLQVFRDTNGNNFYDPGTDLLAGTQATVNVGSTTAITTSSNNSIAATGGLPTSFFITLKTDSTWAAPDAVKVTMATNGIATSANSPTLSAAFSGNEINANLGGSGGGFQVEEVNFVNSTTLDVVFSDNLDLNSGNATSTSNYTLTTADGDDTSTISQVIVLPDNKSVRVESFGAVIVSSGTDTLAVSANVKNDLGIANAYTGTTPIFDSFQPLVISEIQVGTDSSQYDEFIELYNRGGAAIGTSTLYIHVVNADGTKDTNLSLTFMNGVSIPSNGYFLIAPIGSTASTTADAVYATSSLYSLIPDGAAYVSFSSATSTSVIDKVCWGSHSVTTNCEGAAAAALTNNGQSIERKANNLSTAATMTSTDASNGNGSDTDNNTFDFVARTTPQTQNSSAATEAPSGGSFGGANNSAPIIEHVPLFNASTSSTLTVVARMTDDGGELAASKTLLAYCVTDTTCTPASSTPIFGSHIGSGWFKFTTTSTLWANYKTKFNYYLQATDQATPALTKVLTADPSFDNSFDTSTNGIQTATLQKSKAITITLAQGNSGAASISGTVNDSSGVAVEGATVWIEGTQFSATTGNDGTYSFSNIGPPGGRTIRVAKSKYVDSSMSIFLPSSGLVSLPTITLVSGTVGSGGDFSVPEILDSFPPNNSAGFPTQDPDGTTPSILLNFSKTMDSTTVADSDASDAGSNIYLTVVGSSTKLGGVVTAVSNTQAKFKPSANLTAGSGYNLFVTPGVRDSAGNGVRGNGPGGAYVLMFSTSDQFVTDPSLLGGGGGDSFGSGSSFPPFVEGGMPSPGSSNTSLNTKMFVKFSEAMQDTSANRARVVLYSVANQFTASETKTAISTTNSFDTSSKILTLTPGGNLTASTHYRVEVLGGITSSKGIPLGNPGVSGYATQVFYSIDFDTGTTSDSTAPTIRGTIPTDAATGVSTVKPILISFSEAMDPSTISKSTVAVKLGSTAVDGELKYDPNTWKARFAPTYALTATSTYTVSVTTGVKDLAGNAIASAAFQTFTTGSADTSAPTVVSAQGNDFAMEITFSKPMLAVPSSDTVNYTSSVLNPSNYVIKKVDANGAQTEAISLPSTATVTYDPIKRRVVLEGFKLTTGLTSGFSAGSTLLNISVNNATDIGLNTIASGANSATSTAAASSGGGSFGSEFFQDASGNIVQGGTFGPAPDSLASFTSGGIGFIPNVKVLPFNSQAGVVTVYAVELPISKQVPATGLIEITFPEGVDVSGAKKDSASPKNADINGPGTGTVVFGTTEGTLPSGWVTGGTADDGVIVNTSSRTVRVILGAVATRSESIGESTDTHDFLMLDIDGITNATISDTGGGSGSSTTVTTKKADGTALETQTSGAFFTTAAGTMTVRGQVLAGGSGVNAVTVYLNGMTGSQSTTTAANRYGGAAGEFLFQNVNTGFAMLGTERFVRVGATDYTGSNPEPININTSDCTSSTCNRNLTITDASTGAPVTFSISGTFSSDDVDFFAGGPNTFRMATGTLNGTLSANTDNSIRLNANGKWFVGFGPALKGNVFNSGGPPAPPAWIVPAPQEVIVSNCSTTCVATPNVLNFSATAADKTVKYTVKDQASSAIGQAFVFAYSPNGIGAGSQANADGTGSLNLSNGTYKIGASVEGMPSGNERTIELRTVNSTDTIFIDGASTGVALSAMTNASLVLTVSKPAYTISGKVTDGTNPISDAAVDAFRTDGAGFAHGKTNSSGEYTLYVDNGTWKVSVFTPQEFGRLPSKTITINGSNASSKNFEPNTGTINYGTFTVSVGVDANSDGNFVASEAQQNVQVVVQGTSAAGEDYFNMVMTDSNGSSTMKVPPGTYTVSGFSPTLGELPAFSSSLVVNSSGTVTTAPNDLLIPKSGTVTINVYDSEGNATTTDEMAVELQLIGGTINNAVSFGSVSSTSFTMPVYDAGSASVATGNVTSTNPANFYLLKLSSPGLKSSNISLYGGSGTVLATSTAADGLFKVEVDGDETINIHLPQINYMSGTVKDADGTAVANAVVQLENTSTGETLAVTADSSGVYSAKVSDGTYTVQANKDGYLDTATSVTVSASGTLAAALTTMTATNRTVAGNITANATSSVGATVRAEKLGGGVVTATTDNAGAYSLNLTDGEWKISAAVDGFQEEAYSGGVVSVAGSNVTSIDITANDVKSGLAGSTSQTVTPQTGGSLNDSSAGLKVKAPGSALAISSSNFSLSNKETSNVVAGGSGVPIGGEAKSISSYDNDGALVTTLKDEIGVSASYSLADIESSIGTLTLAKLEKIKMSSWDTSADKWENLATTISYKDSSGNYIEPASDLSNVKTIAYTGQTAHLSVFNATESSDGLAPSAPTGVTAVASTDEVELTWTAPTTNSDASSLTDLLGYEVYRSTSAGGTYTQVNTTDVTGTSFSDSTVTRGTSYFYKITAADTGGVESVYSSATDEATPLATNTVLQGAGAGGGGGSSAPASVPATADPADSSTESAEADSASDTADSSAVEEDGSLESTATEVDGSTVSAPTKATAPSDYTFTKYLTIGSTGSEVSELQTLLKALGHFTYPTITGYFGPITATAVKAFQAVNGLDQVGFVGPGTRAALNSSGGTSAPKAAAPTPASKAVTVSGAPFTSFLGTGSTGDTVRQLQQLLKDLGHFTHPTITGYFGPVTAQAVKAFQAANGIAQVGFVGPQTRGALNSKTSGASVVVPPAAPPATPAAPASKAAVTFTKFMKIGSVGQQVRDLQQLLKDLGHFTHPTITGYFGPITSAAVKAFQQANGVDGVGYVGPATRAALNAAK